MINLNDSLETLIRTSECPEGIDWFGLCQCFLLPEDFIREFADYIDWDVINNFQYSHLSNNFKNEFRSYFYNG